MSARRRNRPPGDRPSTGPGSGTRAARLASSRCSAGGTLSGLRPARRPAARPRRGGLCDARAPRPTVPRPDRRRREATGGRLRPAGRDAARRAILAEGGRPALRHRLCPRPVRRSRPVWFTGRTRTASCVARVGPTTPTRARRPIDASVDPTEAQQRQRFSSPAHETPRGCSTRCGSPDHPGGSILAGPCGIIFSTLLHFRIVPQAN